MCPYDSYVKLKADRAIVRNSPIALHGWSIQRDTGLLVLLIFLQRVLNFDDQPEVSAAMPFLDFGKKKTRGPTRRVREA